MIHIKGSHNAVGFNVVPKPSMPYLLSAVILYDHQQADLQTFPVFSQLNRWFKLMRNRMQTKELKE